MTVIKYCEMYSNDKLDQVESLTRGTISDGAIATPTFTENFSPDGFGNKSSYDQTVDGSTTIDQTSTFGPTNQVQDFTGDGWATPSFDAAGNATATPNPLAPTTALNLQVDGWNNVTHVSNTSDSIDVSQFYDALGNMIVRVNNLAASGEVSTTDIYYSGSQVLEEDPRLPTDPASDATAVGHQYIYSPRSVNTPILDTQTSYTVVSESWTSASSTYYFLTDANDNVTAVTDSSGAVQERYVYAAFGTATIYNSDYSATRTVSSVNNTILFAGMMIDPDTGLYKDAARFYSSLTSTFLTTDPAQSDFDTYRYVGNDPIDSTDPTGLAGPVIVTGPSFSKPSNPCSGTLSSQAADPYTASSGTSPTADSSFAQARRNRAELAASSAQLQTVLLNYLASQPIHQSGQIAEDMAKFEAAQRDAGTPAWRGNTRRSKTRSQRISCSAICGQDRGDWRTVAWAQRRYDANQMANMNIVEQLLYITFRPTGYDPVFGPQSNFTMATAIAGPAAASAAFPCDNRTTIQEGQ